MATDESKAPSKGREVRSGRKFERRQLRRPFVKLTGRWNSEVFLTLRTSWPFRHRDLTICESVNGKAKMGN